MFDYYYGNECEAFSFIQIPRVMFTDKEHFGELSNESKLLYALLHERMTLSKKNEWIDEENRVYIIYTIEEICDILNVGHSTAVKLLRELDDKDGIGLITKKRRGLGLASIIYVHNFIAVVESVENSENAYETKNVESVENGVKSGENGLQTSKSLNNGITEFQKTESLNAEKQNSGVPKNGIQEVQNVETSYININQTEKNYIDMSYIDNQSFIPAHEGKKISAVENSETERVNERTKRSEIRFRINQQIEYAWFEDNYENDPTLSIVREIRDIMVDVLCGVRTVVIDGKELPQCAVESAYSRITYEHVRKIIDIIDNYEGTITRMDKFLSTVIYNVAHTYNADLFTGFRVGTGGRLIE